MIYMCFDLTRLPALIILGTTTKSNFEYLPIEKKVNENLLIEMEKILVSYGLRLSDIDAFGCVTGPGSYTGIRISMTTIRAFDVAQRTKTIIMNAFEPFFDLEKNCLALLPNTKTSYYFCKIRNGEPAKYGIIDKDELNLINEKVYSSDIIPGYEEQFKYVDDYAQRIDKIMRHKILTLNYIYADDLRPFYMDVNHEERKYIPD